MRVTEVVETFVDLVTDGCNAEKSTLLLTGFPRTRNLSINQTVHCSGDFQLCKIELLKDPCPLNARKDGDLMDADVHDVQVIRSLVPNPMKQESSLVENVADPLAGVQESGHGQRKQKGLKLIEINVRKG